MWVLAAADWSVWAVVVGALALVVAVVYGGIVIRQNARALDRMDRSLVATGAAARASPSPPWDTPADVRSRGVVAAVVVGCVIGGWWAGV